jgi:hypothetical protein
MKFIKVTGLIVSLLFLVGCASSQKHYLGDHAIKDPAKGVSVVHPVEIEKAGVEKITHFAGIMNPGLWVETAGGGGVWPFLAYMPDGEILDGYGYLAGINYWGDFLLHFSIPEPKKKLKNAKLLYFNQDAGFAYNLTGMEVEYNPKRFDSSEKYREKIFEKGTSFSKISNAQEIVVGSKEWENYKKQVTSIMTHDYKMGDGEIRCGYIPLEDFRKEATKIPGFNSGERFLERAKIPIIPFGGVGVLAATGASIAGDAIAAGIDSDWKGSYARAETLRYKMMPLFKRVSFLYRKLLEERDRKIRNLKQKLNSENF